MYAKRNKKIILRFLKELGLLHAWQSYVKTKRYKQILEIHKKGLYVHSSISNIFRFYVLETSIISGKELFQCKPYNADSDVIIDKKTNTIKFINDEK